MGKHKVIKVGDTFTSKDGVTLVVEAYYDANNVLVKDLDGNIRSIRALDLKGRGIKWRNKDGSLCKSKRDTSLYVKGERGTPKQQMMKKYFVGSVWQSKRFGSFEIVDIKDSETITIKWHSNGGIQSNVNTQAVRTGYIKNTTLEKVADDPSLPKGHYVYMTTVDGEVVYIGRGTGNRMYHTISGASGNKELNRLYFSKARMITEVVQQDMDKEAAKRLEKLLIAKYKPKCCQIMYKI